MLADEIGDALGLNLVAVPSAPVLGDVVEQHVAELMGEGLGGLGLAHVAADRNRPVQEVGGAIGTAAVASMETEAGRGDLDTQHVLKIARCPATEQCGSVLKERLTLCLGHVEDVDDPEPAQGLHQLGSVGLFLGGRLAGSGSPERG